MDLASIAAVPDQKQRVELYKTTLQDAVASSSQAACIAFVEHMLSNDVPLVISRQMLQIYAQDIAKLPPDVHKMVAQSTLERLQPRVVSFEETVTLMRENLAALLEQEEQWAKAAQTLAGIDLESGMRNVDPQYKLEKNIKIAMLYLEDDDPVNAESYIKKASSLISSSKDERLELQYKTCYARVLDSKRRFLDAALRYYELSSLGTRIVGGLQVCAEDLTTALQAAVTCTILAPAGPQRSRMLSALYKDERSARLEVFPFLEKVYMERILSRAEVDAFAKTLKPHQMAVLPDSSTVLDKAVMQHNLLAASKLYNNISIDELGPLLGVPPEKAEALAADMISEGRLTGLIDQVERTIYFDTKVEQLLLWDAQITAACTKINQVVDDIAAQGLIRPAAAAM